MSYSSKKTNTQYAKTLQKIRQVSNYICKAKIQASRQINKQGNSHNTYESRAQNANQ